MTKAEAKRAACRIAATDLDNMLDNGGEGIDVFGDRDKIEAALRELIAELNRRGRPPRVTLNITPDSPAVERAIRDVRRRGGA